MRKLSGQTRGARGRELSRRAYALQSAALRSGAGARRHKYNGNPSVSEVAQSDREAHLDKVFAYVEAALVNTRARMRASLDFGETEVFACANCHELEDNHTETKQCLFAPSRYVPMSDEEMDKRFPGKLWYRLNKNPTVYELTWTP